MPEPQVKFPPEIRGAGNRLVEEIKRRVVTEPRFAETFGNFYRKLNDALLINQLHRKLTLDACFFSDEQRAEFQRLKTALEAQFKGADNAW